MKSFAYRTKGSAGQNFRNHADRRRPTTGSRPMRVSVHCFQTDVRITVGGSSVEDLHSRCRLHVGLRCSTFAWSPSNCRRVESIVNSNGSTNGGLQANQPACQLHNAHNLWLINALPGALPHRVPYACGLSNEQQLIIERLITKRSLYRRPLTWFCWLPVATCHPTTGRF